MTHPDMGDEVQPERPGGLDLQAVERLFQEHFSPLTRFVHTYVRSWEAAEDIVHDVFFQLWLRHRTLEPVRDLAAYLYTIARYDALDYLRHRGVEARYRDTTEYEVSFGAEADHELLADDVAATLHRAIDALPDRQREIILLRWKDQASYDEIAAKLQISPKTVDAHIQRAFARLRKLLPRLLA